MAKTITAPLSGTRDFLPVDVHRRRFVIDVVERVYQRYGFEPLETPVMERLETLLGKYGEEGDQLIFRIMKRGQKLDVALEDGGDKDSLADAGLRYDLTVPLARVVAEHQHQLPTIIKRYQIQPVYRADRPARGRYREFYQCDVDVAGSDSMLVECEVLNAAAEIMQELGFRQTADFRIRLNDRDLLRRLVESVGIPADLEESALVALDKLDKIGRNGVEKDLNDRGIQPESGRLFIDLISQLPNSSEDILNEMEERLAQHDLNSPGISNLRRIVQWCGPGSAGPHLVVDPSLARGLSYYTGPIFEIEVPGYPGSAGAGGRYDDLIGLFSGRQIPACGFSLGLERLLLILEEKEMFPGSLAGQPQLLMTLLDEEMVPETLVLLSELRKEGLRVDLYPSAAKIGKQFKYAEQKGIRFALLLGPDELSRNRVSFKDLDSGEQEAISREELAATLRERLS